MRSYYIMMDWLVKPRQRAKFEGRYNFHLQLNTEAVDSSSSISITCWADKGQRAAVPCTYIWFIIKNGLPQEVANFKGCTFICDTSHIGYYVQAHVISNDAEYNGKAIVTFGPVELDVSLKTGILGALSTGMLELPVYFVSAEQEEKQGMLQLCETQIKLTHNYSEANYIFDYSIIEPQMAPHAREIAKATITFNEKYEAEMRRFERRLFSTNELTSSKSSSYMNATRSNLMKTPPLSLPKLEIKFANREARDSFFFTVKAFIAKRELKNAAVIRKIENINFEREEDFNAILELDTLKSDLIRYDRLYKQAQLDRKKLQDENARMERELAGNRADLSMNVNYSAATRRDDPVSKLARLEDTNQQLNVKIARLSNELDQARGKASVIMKPQMTLSPFSRRREEDESIVELLEDLSRYDPQKQIENLEQEKKSLEAKLEHSFEKISLLESKLKAPNATTSAINFTYKYSQAAPGDHRLKQENEELQKANAALQNENKLLTLRIEAKLKNESKVESHLTRIREQNRNTDLLIESRIENEKIAKLTQEVDELTSSLRGKESEMQRMLERCQGLQRRVQEGEAELQMLRRNQDVLNRSQHMSLQMESYSEEQIKMLKQHNDFLIEENEKLVRACEKYMADAKQNNALRKEIIQLREKITHLRTNPETSSFTA